MTARTWTPERIERARALYLQEAPRLSREEIAAELGVTFNALRTALGPKCGIKPGDRPGWTRGRGFPAGTTKGPIIACEDDDPDVMPAGRVVVQRHRIWCLGPIEPRHKFWSDDPRTHRICDKCRRAMAGTMEEHDGEVWR